MKNKKAMEFAWIFAIVLGAIILFLAFYFLGSQIFLKEKTRSTETAHSTEILFNPFSYLGAMGAITYKPIEMQKEVQFEFDCDPDMEIVGSNTIIVDSSPRTIYDKYIFSENLKAKRIETISKSFEMPWRIADLIYVFPSGREYCFIDAPSRIEEEIELLNISNIFFQEPCPENATKVCFGREGCEIKVTNLEGFYHRGFVEKSEETGRMYFIGDNYALLLGAIFSSRDLYNCNLKRLAKRILLEVNVYREKQRIMAERGCAAEMNLESLEQAASNVRASANENNLNALYQVAKEIKNQNSYECPLF
ncbi:MAG: hypothetical protein QXP53_00945 [Candidatus Pacearchaeota archaeon]